MNPLVIGSKTIAGVAESLVVAVAAFAAILDAVAAYVRQKDSRRNRAEAALAGTATAWASVMLGQDYLPGG